MGPRKKEGIHRAVAWYITRAQSEEVTMPYWVFIGIMGAWSVASIVFAFVEPPQSVRSLFKVPAIFVFLPDRWVMPVGRVFAGLCGLGLCAYLLRYV